MNAWAYYDEWERLMTLSPETRDAVREGCKRSAAAVLPVIFNTLGTPTGIIDVGAGEGWWTFEAQHLGVGVTCAMDVEVGGSINPFDAERGDALPGYYPGDEGLPWPLAMCLETAEHVTPAAGDHLVAELCRVSTEIVWSAAIPGQGGDGHINEQWPAYWAERFNRHGFVLDDPWRDDLWDDPSVEPWYAQNLLYAYRPAPGYERATPPPRALVHPVTWAHYRGVEAP